jgi:uncharacterized protein
MQKNRGETMGDVTSGPASERIETLDFIRGCALFGILLMNITSMGLAKAYTNPTNAGGATGPDLWAWIITEVGFEGTQRALFSMLFGAGVLLFVSRAEQSGRADAVDLFLRRTLWLIVFGLLNAWVLLWEGDILYFYGITGLFVVAFRKLSARALLAIGLAGLLFNAALGAKDSADLNGASQAAAAALAVQKTGKPLTDEQKEAIDGWKEISARYVAKPGEVDKANAAMRGGYIIAWPHVAESVVFMESWFLYRYWFDIFSMMVIGMALLKTGVLTGAASARLYAAMLVGGYGVGLTTNILETRWIVDHGFSPNSFAQAQVTYELGRLAMATGHLGVMLLFCRSGLFGWLRRSLAAVGRMALTNYLTHSLVALILFVFFKQFGQFARHELYYIVFTIWAAQLILSPIWLRHYRFGPVEWLWRALTYLKAPPFRRSAPIKGQLAPAE